VEEVRERGEDECVPCLEYLVDVLVLDGDSATRRFGQGFHTDPVGAEEMTGRSFGCPAIANDEGLVFGWRWGRGNTQRTGHIRVNPSCCPSSR